MKNLAVKPKRTRRECGVNGKGDSEPSPVGRYREVFSVPHFRGRQEALASISLLGVNAFDLRVVVRV